MNCVLTGLMITLMTVIQSHTILCFSLATYTVRLSVCVKNASTYLICCNLFVLKSWWLEIWNTPLVSLHSFIYITVACVWKHVYHQRFQVFWYVMLSRLPDLKVKMLWSSECWQQITLWHFVMCQKTWIFSSKYFTARASSLPCIHTINFHLDR